MNDLKVFIMALYAVKPDPKFMRVVEQEEGHITYRLRLSDGETQISAPIGLVPHIELAESADEAKQMGLDVALELFPRFDGWTGHTAVVKSRSLQQCMREAFGPAMGCESEAEHNVEDEFPEVIL